MKHYTAQEIAKMLKVDQSSVYGWVKDGKMSCTRTGRSIRISADDLEEYFVRHRAPALPAAPARAQLSIREELERQFPVSKREPIKLTVLIDHEDAYAMLKLLMKG